MTASDSDLGHIPGDWRVATLGEVVSEMKNGTTAEQNTEGRGVPVTRIETIATGRIDRARVRHVDASGTAMDAFRLQTADILLSHINSVAHIGKVARYEGGAPLFHGMNLMLLRLDPKKIDPAFGFIAVASPRAKAYFENRCKKAVSQASLNRGDLAALRLPLPPLGEQRKIAAILSAVDDAIEATQAVIDQLQVVKKAMMSELLTRGIPGRHTRFKQTETGEVPEEWSVRPCGELFEVQLGKMMSVQAKAGRSQLPYLRNENVRWLQLDMTDVATMHFDDREREKFRLQAGDLLACEGRHIGRCAIWKGELDDCYYQKALHRLRPRSSDITTEYMQFFMMLRFHFMTDLVAEANTTSTIPHLPRERLLLLPVWHPPRAEQDEIVEALTAELEREHREAAYRDALNTLKAALMSALLTGELRVTPDGEAA